jgi:endoglycosylceramidase
MAADSPWSRTLHHGLLAIAGAGSLACTTPSPRPDASTDASSEAAIDGGDGSTGIDGEAPRYVMPSCAEAAMAFAPLATRCQHLVDARGRVVVLRGVNARIEGVFDVTFTDERMPVQPIPAFGLEDALRMRALGFNFLRLPINWSGVEPQMATPAAFDEAYLGRVRAVVDLARRAGLLVLIDFHQDAFSKEIGEDGAPLWAIQPPPERLLGGPITAEELTRRRTSTQVIRAFETFFGPDGRGPALRTRFAEMAAEVARRFRDDEAVFGFELFNEPLGSDEQGLALHRQVGEAIRAVAPNKLLVFEPPATRNIVDRAMVPSERFPLPGAVYAPHIYTLALAASDTARRGFTIDTLRASHVNAVREARAWGTPLLVTEWGYDPNGIRVEDYVAAQSALQDEYGEGAALWLWKERSQGAWGLFDYDDASGRWTERAGFRRALARVYPEAIAGWPRFWRYDRAALRFELAFDAAVDANHALYVPEAQDFAPGFTVTCDGRPVEAPRDPATGRVEVRCDGPGEHRVVLLGTR